MWISSNPVAAGTPSVHRATTDPRREAGRWPATAEIRRNARSDMDTLTSHDVQARDGGAAEATFTKWMVGEGPEMAGVVGGVVGAGAYQGRVLDHAPGPIQKVIATYTFEGSDRSFTALVYVEQTGLDGDVSGLVVDGWGKGRAVRGAFREIRCDHDGTTTDCWQGSVRVVDD